MEFKIPESQESSKIHLERRIKKSPEKESPEFVSEFRNIIRTFVLQRYNPEVTVVGLTPRQKKITEDFEKQTTIKGILKLAEEILGEPLDEDAVEVVKEYIRGNK